MNDTTIPVPAASEAACAPPADLLRRLDLTGPRYTSYPTADRFVEAWGPQQQARALRERRGGPVAAVLPLSLYVHIPFCESVCYYCACNKVVTRQHGRAAPYLRLLAREASLHTALIGAGQAVSQLHLGGGTPTFLSDDELSALMAIVRSNFRLVPGGEFSVEVDPRTVTRARLAHLAGLGFNRLSFGVQDLDPRVQQAVHRVQPLEQVAELVRDARALGFESLNLDLIHGLPLQTPASFARTVDQVVALRPDRVALYGYAHLPERFKPQRRITAADLPNPPARLAMLQQSLDALVGAGYVHIGMDHFALPGDALAVAKRQGRLHRNFQGYSTQPDCDLIGLGVSAISRIGRVYSQNAKTLAEYEDHLGQGLLATVRGLALDRDDLARRAVIMALMCQGEVLYESIEVAWLIGFADYFGPELERLRALEAQGLVRLDADGIRVTPEGWWVVRAIAMVFDRHLHADRQRARFSRIL